MVDRLLQQRKIYDRCFHPTAPFVEFKHEDLEHSIPQRFEFIAQKFPKRVAVKSNGHALTYEELNSAANRVAQSILAVRGEKEEPIAVLLDDHVSMISAILGTLKAGKIYTPLGLANPTARLAWVLENSEACLIITDNKNLRRAQEVSDDLRLVLNIDDLDLHVPAKNPGLRIQPDHLALLVYTSGSTGQPKGVLHSHRSQLHHAMKLTNILHVTHGDRFYRPGSSSSAGGTRPIWWILLNGATFYINNFGNDGLPNLATWLREEGITIFGVNVNTFRAFVQTFRGDETFPALRLLRLLSDQVNRSDVESYKRHFSPPCILTNSLGCSEAGMLTCFFIDHETVLEDIDVPVGYPVIDTETLILDEDGKLAGEESIGEIVAKSRYLSPGYWKNPELTRATFLEDPNGGEERLYLTGDIGRMAPDGCLMHLGRKAFRMKVRGFSVEAAEIEAALLKHPDIKQAVVTLNPDGNFEQSLVAYVVPSSGTRPSVSQLRKSLREQLPEYMVPSQFMIIEKLPLTNSGKIDRRALPKPDRSRPDLATAFVPYRNGDEQKLIDIWTQVLGLDQIGVYDNFFDLGGHSLAAMRVAARVLRHFRLQIPLQSLFESPTVADMATLINQHRNRQLSEDELTQILSEVESLSEEEASSRFREGKIKS